MVHMAQSNPQQTPSADQQDPLKPGTFQSLLPIVEDILDILHSQVDSQEKITTAQASEDVATKAKQLASAIENMKLASINLPGGHLSIDEIRALSDKLDEEGEKRRSILSAFEKRPMPLVDKLGSGSNGMEESTSVMPSPSGN